MTGREEQWPTIGRQGGGLTKTKGRPTPGRGTLRLINCFLSVSQSRLNSSSVLLKWGQRQGKPGGTGNGIAGAAKPGRAEGRTGSRGTFTHRGQMAGVNRGQDQHFNLFLDKVRGGEVDPRGYVPGG